jgi:thiamine pyrophosphate-dependent acetolactate synthase large subunit-like protein
VRIAQIDIQPEELGNNSNNCIQIQADLKSFCEQVSLSLSEGAYFTHFIFYVLKMNSFLDQNSKFDLNHSIKSDWSKVLKEKIAKNKGVIEVKCHLFFLNCYISHKMSTTIKKMANDISTPLNYYAAYAQVIQNSNSNC